MRLQIKALCDPCNCQSIYRLANQTCIITQLLSKRRSKHSRFNTEVVVKFANLVKRLNQNLFTKVDDIRAWRHTFMISKLKN